MKPHSHLEITVSDTGIGIPEDKLERIFESFEQICEIVRQNCQRTAQEIQQAVIDDVRQFIGEQKVFDDITLLVLKQQ